MKKNRMMRLASGLLVAVLLTTCVISGTFAKYVSEAEGSDIARVAKFDVNTTAGNFNIFEVGQIYDTYGDPDYTVKENDEDVKDAAVGEDGIVAPGTWGEFSFVVEDKSEVTVAYAINYEVDEAGVPLEWSVDNGLTWTNDLADVTGTVGANDTLTENVRVMWRWAFETGADAATIATNDKDVDTPLGEAGSATPKVDIKVTFTQVD